MLNFDCNKCTHQNVCAYKGKYPIYQDIEEESIFEVKVHCKEYKERLTLPNLSDIPIPSVTPYATWASGTSGKETECQAYREYVERAKHSEYVVDSPCSYCLKTNCPRSHVVTCSNESNQGELQDADN